MGGVCDAYRREKKCMPDFQKQRGGKETTLKAYANMSVYY